MPHGFGRHVGPARRKPRPLRRCTRIYAAGAYNKMASAGEYHIPITYRTNVHCVCSDCSVVFPHNQCPTVRVVKALHTSCRHRDHCNYMCCTEHTCHFSSVMIVRSKPKRSKGEPLQTQGSTQQEEASTAEVSGECVCVLLVSYLFAGYAKLAASITSHARACSRIYLYFHASSFCRPSLDRVRG